METKKWLIVSTSFIVLGLISFIVIMSIFNWDFKNFNTTKIETNTYELEEDFDNISINFDEVDINLLVTEEAKVKVVCVEESKAKHNVTISENTLNIAVENSKKWYDYIGVFSPKTKIDIYLPKVAYEKLEVKGHTGDISIPKDFTFKSIDIKTSTGDIENYASANEFIKLKASTGKIKLENINSNSLDILVSTGDVNLNNVNCENDITIDLTTGKTVLTNVSCNNLTSIGNTGDISLNNVILNGKLYIERSTGDTELNKCDANEIEIITTTGDVNCTLLSSKIFIVDTNTGDKNVPETTTGGLCKIKTDTGDINIQIVNN